MNAAANERWNDPAHHVAGAMGGVVLAAGRSQRMGEPKPLIRCGKLTFLERVIEGLKAAEATPLVIVTSPALRLQVAPLAPAGTAVVDNPRPELGMAESLRLGLRALDPAPSPPRAGRASDRDAAAGPTPHPAVGAVLVALVDHPFVRLETWRELGRAARANPGRIVQPVFQGQIGHPTVIPAAIFADVFALTADRGLDSVIAAHESLVVRLCVADPGVVTDIDTREDLEAALRALKPDDR
ncbi:MAG: nucleotidyltransferase family protein [Candidatus Sumerlaeia bacterium]